VIKAPLPRQTIQKQVPQQGHMRVSLDVDPVIRKMLNEDRQRRDTSHRIASHRIASHPDGAFVKLKSSTCRVLLSRTIQAETRGNLAFKKASMGFSIST
jgi:hypothetical protein